MTCAPRVVAGVGNRLRGDDAAGPAIAELVRLRAPRQTEVVTLESDTTSLVEIVERARLVIVADAAAGGGDPGTIHRFEAPGGPVVAVPAAGGSTHGLGPGEAIELARALGRLRARVVIYAITGGSFTTGAGLSDAVARAVPRAAGAILRELAASDGTHPSDIRSSPRYTRAAHDSGSAAKWRCMASPSSASSSAAMIID